MEGKRHMAKYISLALYVRLKKYQLLHQRTKGWWRLRRKLKPASNLELPWNSLKPNGFCYLNETEKPEMHWCDVAKEIKFLRHRDSRLDLLCVPYSLFNTVSEDNSFSRTLKWNLFLEVWQTRFSDWPSYQKQLKIVDKISFKKLSASMNWKESRVQNQNE